MPSFTNQVDKVSVLAQAENVTVNLHEAEKPAALHLIPAFVKRVYKIVGRDDLLDQLFEAFKGEQRSAALMHLPGVGKTTLATLLARDKRLPGLFTGGVLWAQVGRQCDVRSELRKWAVALGISESRMKDFDSQSDWSDAVAQAIGDRHVLLIIDDVWAAADARWFQIDGAHCAHLFTTRHPGVAAELSSLTIEVDRLSVPEGIELLRSLAPRAVALDVGAAEDLVRDVGGLPLALVLIGHYLRQKGERRDAASIRAALKTLNDIENVFKLEQQADRLSDATLSLASVIEVSYQALDSGAADAAPLRRAIEALSVLRPDTDFEDELAHRVSGVPLNEVRDVLGTLCDAGLVQATFVDQAQTQYSIHRTIAEYMRRKLDTARSKALNLAAAAYYRVKLRSLEDGFQTTATSYERWYLYENLEWQACTEHWLYHLAHADEQRQVLMSFLRAWFDGFWWWGCFLDFNFCKRLIFEWRRRKLDPHADEGLELLQRFMDAYPKETETRAGDWAEVKRLLTSVRTSAAIAGDAAQLDSADTRQVRGLTDVFLAEAERFGAGDMAAAEVLYRDALVQFEHNGDDWNAAWSLYHLADMLVEHGSVDAAPALCHRSLALALPQKDPEIQALLQRVLGDVCAAHDDWPGALAHYIQAVQHAYRFQIDPLALPDAYTLRFYAQLVQTVAQRLLALDRESADAARAAAKSLHRSWHGGPAAPMAAIETALREVDASALGALIFEPPGGSDLLGDLARAQVYAQRVGTVLARRAG